MESIVYQLEDHMKRLGYISNKVASQVEGKMGEISEDEDLKKAWNELKELVEAFCGQGTVDKFMNQVK